MSEEKRTQSRPAGGPGGRAPMGAAASARDGQTIKHLMRLLKYVLTNYKWHCLMVLIAILVSVSATLCGMLFIQSLIDDYITPLLQAASPDYSSLEQALFKLAAIFLAGALCAYLNKRIMVNVSQGTMKRLRKDVFENMESLPIKYFDTHSHGSIMSVYTNDMDTLRQLIGESMPQLINSCITLVASFVSMVVLSVPLSIISVLMVCLMLFCTIKLSSISGGYFTLQQKALGDVDGYIEEMIEGQKVVKVFCHEEKCIDEFNELNQKLRENSQNANIIANIAMPINVNIGNLSYVLCAIIGGILAINGYGDLTVGTLVAFLSLSKNFTQPISQISMQLNSMVMGAAGARRVFNLYDQESETDDGYVELTNVVVNSDGTILETEEETGAWAWKDTREDGESDLIRLCGNVKFSNVDFSYIEEKQVLYDINMYAKPGQTIALVGSTGAGKTTITNLINRFYDIQDGTISYDGINIQNIKKPDLRRSLGIVLQDSNLFTGTVMENIRYGRPDATDEECIEAAKLANADSFVRRLPDGYNTVLRNAGANLSQGQRQMLTIARMAVANPPVIILDEATSSIDTRTEKLVQQGMDAVMKNRTSFVIAHRLSTVRDADCIMVIEDGRIIERGTHDELIKEQGRYYQLYTGNAVGE